MKAEKEYDPSRTRAARDFAWQVLPPDQQRALNYLGILKLAAFLKGANEEETQELLDEYPAGVQAEQRYLELVASILNSGSG